MAMNNRSESEITAYLTESCIVLQMNMKAFVMTGSLVASVCHLQKQHVHQWNGDPIIVMSHDLGVYLFT